MLNYTVRSRQNPINKSVKYYGQLESPLPVNLDQIAQRISASSTVNPADVSAVLTALESQVLYALQDGMSVRLGKVGTFRVTLKSLGTDTLEEFHSSNIHGVRGRFTPAAQLRKGMSPTHPDIKFHQVQSRLAAPAPQEPPTDPGSGSLPEGEPGSGLEHV